MTRNEALQSIYTRRVNQLSKLTALAEKLNDGWKPDWLDADENKYYIATDFNEITVHARKRYAPAGVIFFKSEEDALEAISQVDTEILFDNIDSFIAEIGLDGEYAILPTSKQMLAEARELLETNGFITTLDFKKALRAKNLYMTQEDASSSLANMAVEQNWHRKMHDTGRYIIYTE